VTLIDDRGRVFGRVNLIDFLAAVMLLGLIPLGYGGYLLFRVPDPVIATISPDQVVERRDNTLVVTGEHIRPFLDVRFGSGEQAHRAQGFLVQGSTRAEVKVPLALPPGTYDVVVMDQGRTLYSKPGGLTVLPARWAASADTEVQVLGTFTGLNGDEARSFAVGSKFAPAKDAAVVGEVLALRPPAPAVQTVKVAERGFISLALPGQLEVQAILRLRCTLRREECRVGEAVVAQDNLIVLPASASRSLSFVVEEVRPVNARAVFASQTGKVALASVRVRFSAPKDVLDVMKPGDLDVPGAGVVAESDRAVLTDIGADRQPATITGVVTAGNAARQLQQPGVTFTGTVRVRVISTATGWTYKDRPIKAGAAFHFETVAGVMTGWIVDVKIEPDR
jgi:hypothetical protein